MPRKRPSWIRAQWRWIKTMYLTPWIERIAS